MASFNRIYKPQVEAQEWVPPSSVYVKTVSIFTALVGIPSRYVSSLPPDYIDIDGGVEVVIALYIVDHPTHTFTYVSDNGSEWIYNIYETIPGYYHTVLIDDSNWNSAAISIASITGSCATTFRVKSSSTNVVCGINKINNASDIDHTAILYAFQCIGGQYRVYESGVGKTTLTNFIDTDVFKIVLYESLYALYFVNDILIYTSETTLTGFTYVVDAAFYKTGDTIWDATLTKVDNIIIPSILIEINNVTDYAKGIPLLKPSMYIIT